MKLSVCLSVKAVIEVFGERPRGHMCCRGDCDRSPEIVLKINLRYSSCQIKFLYLNL